MCPFCGNNDLFLFDVKKPFRKKKYHDRPSYAFKNRHVKCQECFSIIFFNEVYEPLMLHNLEWLVLQLQKGVYDPKNLDTKMMNLFKTEQFINFKRMCNCPVCYGNATKLTKCQTNTANRTCAHLLCFDCESRVFVEPQYLFIVDLLRQKQKIELSKGIDLRVQLGIPQPFEL